LNRYQLVRLGLPKLIVGALAALLAVAGSACDPLTPEPEGKNAWQVVSSLGATGAATAITDGGAGAVIIVGGRSATTAPLLWRGTATQLSPLTAPTAAKGLLRAVTAQSSSSGLAVGDAGLVLKYTANGQTITAVAGVAGKIDLRGAAWDGARFWLVGQEFFPNEEPPERGVVLKLDGDVVTRVTDLPAGAEVGGAFQAVWAGAGGTIYVAGSTDEILSFRAGVWTATPADGFRLNAIHGNGTIVVAVGGRSRASVLEDDGTGFRDISPVGAPVFYDVHVSNDGLVTAVGGDGSIWERLGSTWRSTIDLPQTLGDVLAVHVAEDGQRWAAGGQWLTSPLRGGFVWSSAAPTP